MVGALPESEGHDAILNVVDLRSKQLIAIPCNVELSAEGWAQLFFQHVYRRKGLPRKVISDRGPQFVSRFLKALYELLGIKGNPSTPYHPQTDGQTERVNQEIEQYLRIFINHRQNDWVRWLPIAEFCYNDRVHASTGYSPFYLNSGRHPWKGRPPDDRSVTRRRKSALEVGAARDVRDGGDAREGELVQAFGAERDVQGVSAVEVREDVSEDIVVERGRGHARPLGHWRRSTSRGAVLGDGRRGCRRRRRRGARRSVGRSTSEGSGRRTEAVAVASSELNPERVRAYARLTLERIPPRARPSGSLAETHSGAALRRASTQRAPPLSYVARACMPRGWVRTRAGTEEGKARKDETANVIDYDLESINTAGSHEQRATDSETENDGLSSRYSTH
ncbi:hypothetical protein NUW54_g13776 [Trametes sanguinea]|uniref:Uncharacterized protein n=1 Tax=Trametes sanguinea TaxID=158606 RepID=A0ACC1MJT8_9APHY|nr:hypothetical protein NUW54_g13776 [Trametes sanguinea]